MTLLKQANQALRESQYEIAIAKYVRALQESIALPHLIKANLKIAQARYLKTRTTAKPSVCICGWNLAHNAAGRVATLAQLYYSIADVSIVGCYFKQWGSNIWEPLRNFPVPIHGIQIQDEKQFINQALEMVLQHPCDLLHLSKPRFPNIVIGALYKLIWNSRVIVDVDDEELAFVKATTPLSIEDYNKVVPGLIELENMAGEVLTRLGVGLVDIFDGVTVVNSALQQRYGGDVVRHARDEKFFSPSVERCQKSREKFDISLNEKVVLFLGTPRRHKGLLETAKAIAALGRKDVLFLIVGDFPSAEKNLRTEIEAIPGIKVRFLGNQLFENIPDILAVSDLCVLLQDPDHSAARYQTPAKLTDALAMGIPVLAEKTPGLEDLAEKNAFRIVGRESLKEAIDVALNTCSTPPLAHQVFVETLTLEANRKPLELALVTAMQRAKTPLQFSSQLLKLIDRLPFVPESFFINILKGPTFSQERFSALPDGFKLSNDVTAIGDIISLSEQAMAKDDWALAYTCWKKLAERQSDELSIDLLLKISRELFNLDAFADANAVLKKAAEKDNSYSGVILEQAQQYYYHCYSSWLMLVTENEKEWYKVEGLDKKPDWKTACDLIELAEKVVPRNNLRRYVQAYLLLAEDAWDKQQPQEAQKALRIALNAIGPGKLDGSIINVICNCVDQFRYGGIEVNKADQEILVDNLKTLPLDFLEVVDWLCLGDILNWNGLLLCGYLVRERALDVATKQGREDLAHTSSLKLALKAALDKNDISMACDFLGKLKKLTPDDLGVRELESCLELMRGDLMAFRQKWPHVPTPNEKRFRDYVKGKSIALVGPALTEEENGEEIDSFDLVVRTNKRRSENQVFEPIFGTRTDMSICNAHTIRLMASKGLLTEFGEIGHVLVRRISCFLNGVGQPKYAYMGDFYPSFYKSLNSIQSFLFFLLLADCKEVKLFHVDFYSGGVTHHDMYRQPLGSGSSPDVKVFRSVIANHDLLTQVNFVGNLVQNSIVACSAGNAINKFFLSPGSYLSKLAEKRFGFKNKTNLSKVVVLSTGIFSTIMAGLLIEKEGFSKVDILLYSKNMTKSFFEENERFAARFPWFSKMVSLEFYFDNNKFNKSDFEAAFYTDIESIIVPGFRHHVCAEFTNAYSNSSIFLYEEGMASYEEFVLSNERRSRIRKTYLTSPLGLSAPVVLSSSTDSVVIHEVSDVAAAFKRVAKKSGLKVDAKSVLLLGMGLHLHNVIDATEELRYYDKICGDLISNGFNVIFKDHPRSRYCFSTHLKSNFHARIQVVDDVFYPVEALDFSQNINFVVSALSTSMWYLPHLYRAQSFGIREIGRVLAISSSEFNTWCRAQRIFDNYQCLCGKAQELQKQGALPLISIIVAAYNVEKYIEQCLDSLAGQSYKNLEIVIVNDGAKDATYDKIKKYTDKYPNFFCVTKKNGGLSSARNIGYQFSSGEYVSFVDGDDWLSPDAIERQINAMLYTQADVLRCSFIEAYANGKRVRNSVFKRFGLSDKTLSPRDDERILTDIYVAAWAGMFKRNSVLDSARFPLGLYYEDNSYYFDVVSQANKITFLDYPCVFYRKRSESITSEAGVKDIDIIKVFRWFYDQSSLGKRDTMIHKMFLKRVEKATYVHLGRLSRSEYFQPYCKHLADFFIYIGYTSPLRQDCFSAQQVSLLLNCEFDDLRTSLDKTV